MASTRKRATRDGQIFYEIRVSHAEQKESDLRQKREAAKVLTLQQYGETVFMPAKGVTMSENGRCCLH